MKLQTFLEIALVGAVLELQPDSGAVVQVDCAPALQTLAAESKLDGSVLRKLGIEVDLGRTLNKNKNPIAKNAIKEFHKERLKLKPSGGQINEIERAIITKNMNSRIRERGLSSKEMAYNRDQLTNSVKPSDDKNLAQTQGENRKHRHPEKPELSANNDFKIGDNVFLKFDKSKARGREMYKVVKLFLKNDERCALIQKCEAKFLSKEYEVKCVEIFKVPGSYTEPDDKSGEEQDEEGSMMTADPDPGKEYLDDDLEKKDVDETDEKNVDEQDTKGTIEPTEATATSPGKEVNEAETVVTRSRPPRRKTAMKQRAKLHDILDCLKVKTDSVPTMVKPPIHGWYYEDWIRDIEDSDDEIIEEPNLDPITPFTLFLENLDVASFNLPIRSIAQLGGRLQMFPVHEEEDNVLAWDHSTSPEELVPTVEMDTTDINLNVALQPRSLYPERDSEEFSLTSSDSQDDVFDDPGIMEVSINGARRFKRSRAIRMKGLKKQAEDEAGDKVANKEENMIADEESDKAEVTVDDEDLDDEARANPLEENHEEKEQTTPARRRTHRVDYAYLHKYGWKK